MRVVLEKELERCGDFAAHECDVYSASASGNIYRLISISSVFAI